MNINKTGFAIVTLIMIIGLAVPAWSQDAAQSSTQEAAPSSTMGEDQPSAKEAEPPTTMEGTQPPAQKEAESSTMGEDQPSAKETESPSTMEETQPPTLKEAESSDQMSDQSAVQLAEAVVCRDVVDRAPVGSGDVFAKEVPKVYCFTRVVGGEGTQLTYNWYHNGSLKASVKLDIRSANYRTWSSKTMIPEWTGEWMVEILSDDGKPLESIIFYLK